MMITEDIRKKAEDLSEWSERYANKTNSTVLEMARRLVAAIRATDKEKTE